jgi:hypothetical protein
MDASTLVVFLVYYFFGYGQCMRMDGCWIPWMDETVRYTVGLAFLFLHTHRWRCMDWMENLRLVYNFGT